MGPETELPASGFGAQDPRSTIGAVELVCSESGTSGLGGWVGEMDSPNIK